MAEKVYKKNKKKIMCGLTIKKINKKEINLNKFLAYTSLVSTASEKWTNFSIDSAIVVEDFNTIVSSVFDYIDYDKYDKDGLWKIFKKKEMDITIPTMDGCGICTDYTGMIRLPFIKGLMVEFPIRQFIEEARAKEKKEKGNHYTKIGKVYDIYKKKEIDILEKDIKYIFTRSQFKMWRYYSDWNEYKKFFKDLGCEACKCQDEEEEFNAGKMSYQPFQTLYDLTDDELTKLLADVNNTIETIGNSKQNMLKVIGATKNNPKKNNFQQAIELYPELLNDNYCQKYLKEIKKSMITNVKSGKIKVDSIYTFILPDVYAFAEWLFLPHEKENENIPTGLLKRGEISCNLFEDGEKLDLVRSPHLNFEHCINKNVNNDEMKKWYKSSGVYVSINSTDSRELSFDHDGDQVIVIREPIIIKAVERIRKNLDIVPLYYNMKKGEDGIINEQNLYNAMIEAYKGGKIGQCSNSICKIWNSGEITEDKLKAIKYLTFFNNCQIDYAKSHWLPDREENMQEFLTQFTGDKLPYFFQFLKGKNKSKNEVAEINNSVVNRMGKLVTKKNFSFRADNCGDFDYEILLQDKNINIKTDEAQQIINTFINLNSNKKFYSNEETKEENDYTPVFITKELAKINNSKIYVTDILVKYHFEEKKENKRTLWQVYGDIILENIIANLPKNTILCENCGKRVPKTNNRMKYCSDCAKEINVKKTQNNKLKNIV